MKMATIPNKIRKQTVKLATNPNKNGNNSDPKLGSIVAMSCYRSVTRNIRGDMFRRLFFGSFLFAEKEMNKSAIDEKSIMDVKNRIEILKKQSCPAASGETTTNR